jgi:predicted CoA-binding protein
VGFSDELRKNAADCFRRAQDASTLANRTAWLSMAQFWLQLAQYAEEQEAEQSNDQTAVIKNRRNRSDWSESAE